MPQNKGVLDTVLCTTEINKYELMNIKALLLHHQLSPTLNGVKRSDTDNTAVHDFW
jgi:hypothetical protein